MAKIGIFIQKNFIVWNPIAGQTTPKMAENRVNLHLISRKTVILTFLSILLYPARNKTNILEGSMKTREGRIRAQEAPGVGGEEERHLEVCTNRQESV